MFFWGGKKMKNNTWKKALVLGIIILFVGASVVPNISGNNGETSSRTEKFKKEFGSIPLFFTENIGQFPKEVLYQVHTSAATVYLCQDEIVSVFSRPTEIESEVEILSTVARLVDANKDVTIQGEGVLPHHNNYFIGNDPDKWYTDVLNYEAVLFKNVYQGIDLKYHSNENSLKYDFIVSPGVDPSIIQIQYEGIEDLLLTPAGDIQIDTNFGSIYEKKPFIYQEINGIKHAITGRYEIKEPGVFGFAIDKNHNTQYPLVIDPTLVYSTYLGGTVYDIGREIEVDSSGNAYIVGETASGDFPLKNPTQNIYGGSVDAFITKLSSSGSSLIYSTYLGGSNFDYGAGIDIDNSGLAGITGTTYSSDFPTFAAIFPNLNGLQDAFVARLNAAGNALIYSTYLGGGTWEWGLDIAVDGNGFAYVTGNTNSADFPIFNAYDPSGNGGFDIFVSKFDPPGGLLLFSTYLGGFNNDLGEGIDFDSSGNAYVTGSTWSTNFPITPATAYDSSYNGGGDIIVNILDTVTGGPGSLVYGTYIYGQGDDFGYDIAVDNSNIVYVTGWTYSTVNQFFPVTSNAYQQFLQGTTDAYFFKLDTSLTPANQMLYCSYLGGSIGGGGNDVGHSIDLDSNNNAYIAGFTECSDFPTVNSLHTYKGSNDAFASLLDPTAVGSASLLDSTYIGGTGADEGYGIAVDNNDDAYVTGLTYSTDFPTQNPYQATNNGLGDAFVTKISSSGNNAPTAPTINGPTNGDVGTSYTYTFTSIDPDGDQISYYIKWGDGDTTDWTTPQSSGPPGYSESHTWSTQDTYTIEAKATDIHGAESDWATLEVEMPVNQQVINPLLQMMLERFPNAFPILRYLLGL